MNYVGNRIPEEQRKGITKNDRIQRQRKTEITRTSDKKEGYKKRKEHREKKYT
jgi:uncharacterized membrane protein